MGTVFWSVKREKKGKSNKLNMLFFALQVLLFTAMVDESLGCCGLLPTGRSLGERNSDDMEAVHWTFGVCSKDEETCLEERYDGNNITEITGIQLATMHPGSFDFALLESLSFPNAPSMNCEEPCNCLSCGHGHCSDEEDQDKCPGNTSGFICRCSSSPAFPTFQAILRDMMRTGIAC